MKIKPRTMEDQIKWYISAVRGILVCNYGFMEEGEEYLDEHCPHIHMVKELGDR